MTYRNYKNNTGGRKTCGTSWNSLCDLTFQSHNINLYHSSGLVLVTNQGKAELATLATFRSISSLQKVVIIEKNYYREICIHEKIYIIGPRLVALLLSSSNNNRYINIDHLVSKFTQHFLNTDSYSNY